MQENTDTLAAPAAAPDLQSLKEAAAKRFGPFSIPEAVRPALEEMIPAGREWTVRKACAQSLLNKHIAAGDAEEAIKQDRVMISCMKEIDAANERIDSVLRQAMPDLPPDGSPNISIPEWTVNMDYSNAYSRANR